MKQGAHKDFYIEELARNDIEAHGILKQYLKDRVPFKNLWLRDLGIIYNTKSHIAYVPDSGEIDDTQLFLP